VWKVLGGRVFHQGGTLSVTTYTPGTIADGDKIVLTVTYQGDGTRSAALSHQAAYPTPLSYTANADPATSSSTHRFVVAEVSGTAVQHMSDDVTLYHGETYVEDYLVGVTYTPGTRKLEQQYRTRTIVNGVELTITAESTSLVTTAALCP